MKATRKTSISFSFRVIQGMVGLMLVFLVVQAWLLWRVCQQGAAATAGLKNEGLPSLRLLASLGENLAVYRLNCFELMFAQEKDRPAKTSEADGVHRKNEDILKQLAQLYPAGPGNERVQAMQTKLADYVSTTKKVQTLLASDFEAAMKLVDQEVPAKVRSLGLAADELKTYCSTVADQHTGETVGSFGDIRQSVIWFGSAGIAIAALAMVLIALISARVRQALNALAETLSDTSQRVTTSANTVASASQSLAEGAGNQAASIEETSASLEEISSMAKGNADKLQSATDLARQARNAAEGGAQDMESMSTAMGAIKASSDDIAKIIKTIDEIAFQTNILALNAAVEAARAGEAGMGFAVVADEVRNLAQRSAQAAKETAEKIEGAIVKTDQGVKINAKVAAALADIVAKARQVDSLAAEVASASHEQSQGVAQITTAVTQMDSVTQKTAASAEESAAAAQELNAESRAMEQAVADLLALLGGSQEALRATQGRSSARSSEVSSPPSSQRNGAAANGAFAAKNSAASPALEAPQPLSAVHKTSGGGAPVDLSF